MYTELFVQAESDYRRERFLTEAAADRLARQVPGRRSRWSLFNGFKAVPAAGRPAACAG